MISTGLKGLDKVVNGLQLGDNVVWQIDTVQDYIDFVMPYVRTALHDKRDLVYIRFAGHQPLLEQGPGLTIYKLDAYEGFESFSTQLNSIITKHGVGAFYVFDCLSDLLSAWSNDLMIGNFFKITCPYLFELDTIAYFALLRNRHSFKTVARIRETTQLLIDVYHHGGDYYIHPLKVWNRYSPTMFLPHMKKKERFVPIANSVDTATLFSHLFSKSAKSTRRYLDYWDRLFLRAEDLTQRKSSEEERQRMVDQLCRMIIAREEKMLTLARKHLSLEDLLTVKSRMVGTGFIGGKSVGMLLARGIVSAERSLHAKKTFEPHDSFYIGSDVFYTYIVENGWWKLRMEQRTPEGYFTVADTLKEKMLHGVFPEEIKEQFQQMIEYFGQSPIIVRSSSLLEDSFGNIFAGKYESIFLVNQGTPEERYHHFVDAVRRIFASTMNRDALTYRRQRGLDQADEQMALLVQRVSGKYHNGYFFPDVAGVGISYNTFVWNSELDPHAGMLRLVMGLGTRAVNRVEGDYPRIAALDSPLMKPHANFADTRKFSQHDVDLLSIKDNTLTTVALSELIRQDIKIGLELIAQRDEEAMRRIRESGREPEPIWVITFDRLFKETNFKDVMQSIMKRLEAEYGYPVDIEFTVNFKPSGEFQINLLQCRPVQTRGLGKQVALPRTIEKSRIVFESKGNFLGGNVGLDLKQLIYVDPVTYSKLPESAKYDIARLIGQLNRRITDKEKQATAVLGPGRWGTSTASLGVPVSFAEINNFSVLGEISFSSGNAMPELSFGSHFFQDLVETGIFYVALFETGKKHPVNFKALDPAPEVLLKLVPEAEKYKNVVKVYDVSGQGMRLVADIVSQRLVCFFN